ncbi:RrF2 family transcriptional regulator [Paracoccus seriniphilus]|uniref:RrF2 family transcriptional regulator n=1 Tax=Paracoccus seriniphilus TaxID=184748 RepID=UPI0035644D8B
MKLSRYTDYALRVLIQLATQPDRLISISQIAATYDISHNHLMKIVQDLGRAGFVETQRGRNGGLRLGRPADQITIGAVVRHTETQTAIVDCSTCLIAQGCGLPRMFSEAQQAFLAVLDRYRLSDAVMNSDELMGMFQAGEQQINLRQP